MKKNSKKIIIGMSSGVDSSVSALLLKEQGFEVEGLYLHLWNSKKNDKKTAAQVAKKIGINFRTIDAQKRFKDTVVEYFLDEYKKGKTPNPCVYCNENLKFRILFEEMKKNKADYLATGHYARILKNKKGKYELFEAKDKSKNQSYFLYRLKQKQLEKIIFPLGEFKKSEVKKMAKKFGLGVSEKKESQDVCFLQDKKIEEFLRKKIKPRKGEIIDENGKILGKHNGLPIYTIGQRKGISIGGNGPYYVLEKDFSKNKLIVSNNKKQSKLFSKEASLVKVNWISELSKFPSKIFIRIRFRNPLISATIKKDKKNKYKVKFVSPQWAVTPGQSAVFYTKSGKVLGGGIIK